MATSKVNLVNVALIELGRDLITNFDDATPEATRVNTVYDHYLREVLGRHVWSTSIFQASLARTATTPVHTYDFEYQLPTSPEYLRLLTIQSDSVRDFTWAKHGDKILTDATSVSIDYVGFLDDPNLYGPHLTEALTWRLIAGLTYSLTGSSSRHTSNLQIYKAILDQMIAEDSQEGPSQSMYSNFLTKEVR